MSAALPAANFPTLIDIAKLDKGSGYDVIVEAIFSHAEVDLFPASTQGDTTLDVTIMTGLPTGNSFRRPNAGIQPSKAMFDTRRFDMALIDRRVEIDKKGVYDRAHNKPRVLVNQSVPQMQKALSDVSKQIIYGRYQDPLAGFPGLFAQASVDANHMVSAGGTSNLSSVWFLDVSPASMELVFGADVTLTMGDDWKPETIYLPPNNDRLDALVNSIGGWCGFRLLNLNRAVSIQNLGTANGTTLTDNLMVQAMNLCTDYLGFKPTHILGNGRSFEQLRQSRITELIPNPPRVLDYDGVPIVRSINVSTAEETVLNLQF